MAPRSRTREDTRQLLLDVGLALLIERGLSVGLGTVRLAEVAETAGRTTGAAYHIWGSSDDEGYGGGQARFHLELARRAVETIGVDLTEALAVVDEHPAAPMSELIRQGAHRVLDRFTDPEAGWDVVLGLVAAVRSAPELGDAHRKAFTELTEAYCALFEPVLERLGRRIKPPFTLEQVATSVIALADGFGIRTLVDPDAVPTDIPIPNADGEDEPWHLFACGVEAIFEHFTEEVEDADL